MKHIAIFCSAQNVAEHYVVATEQLGRLIALHGHALVWGGSDTGLMSTIAHSVQKNGGKVVGVTMEILKHKAMQGADEMIVAPDLPTRKKMMLERADAVVVLVGGIGTLDEVTEVLELKKHNVHQKPVIMLSTDGFYDGMRLQFERMKSEGFIAQELNTLIYFVTTPEEVMEILAQSFE